MTRRSEFLRTTPNPRRNGGWKDATFGTVNYYLPFWLPLLLAAVPWCIPTIEHLTPSGSQSTAAGATPPATIPVDTVIVQSFEPAKDVSDTYFALLGFWIWAATTNAQSAKLARKGGLADAHDNDEKGKEFSVILLLGAITLILYLLSFHPTAHKFAWWLLVPAMGIPLLFLDRPSAIESQSAPGVIG